MAAKRKKYNPEASRTWRGKSYKKSSRLKRTLIRDLRDKAAEKVKDK